MNAQRLRERADTYSRDAEALRAAGRHDDAITYEVIRDELRRIADEETDASGSSAPSGAS